MTKEEDYLFSKDLRDALWKFKDLKAKECMSSPAFLNALLEHAGLSEKEKKDLWKDVGRPDCYGSDAVLTPDSQDGQLLAVFAQAIYDNGQALIAIYNSFSPATAQGAGLSSLVKINGLARDVAPAPGRGRGSGCTRRGAFLGHVPLVAADACVILGARQQRAHCSGGC